MYFCPSLSTSLSVYSIHVGNHDCCPSLLSVCIFHVCVCVRGRERMGDIVASVYPCVCVCVCARLYAEVQCVLAVVDPGRCAVSLGPSQCVCACASPVCVCVCVCVSVCASPMCVCLCV